MPATGRKEKATRTLVMQVVRNQYSAWPVSQRRRACGSLPRATALESDLSNWIQVSRSGKREMSSDMRLPACIGVSHNAIADKEMQHGCGGGESVFPLNSMAVSSLFFSSWLPFRLFEPIH